jgi:hypothetical protein
MIELYPNGIYPPIHTGDSHAMEVGGKVIFRE